MQIGDAVDGGREPGECLAEAVCSSEGEGDARCTERTAGSSFMQYTPLERASQILLCCRELIPYCVQLRPANILLDAQGRSRLTDCGTHHTAAFGKSSVHGCRLGRSSAARKHEHEPERRLRLG